MARAASAWVSVRGIPARSASALHAAGTGTRSSAREGEASSIRAVTASTAGIRNVFTRHSPDGLIAEIQVAAFRRGRQGRREIIGDRQRGEIATSILKYFLKRDGLYAI